MEDFKIYENAEKLFAENDCVGMENYIFIARKDTNQVGAQAGLSSTLGLAGSAIAGAIAKGDALENIYYDGFLINQTEKGFGFIPLWNKGIVLTFNLEKMEAKSNNFFFVSFYDIEKISVKKLSFINSKIKKLKIILKNGAKIQLLVSVKEKAVSYHEENFERFLQKYEV